MLFECLVWGGAGLIVGSFVNVLILRHRVSNILGRSNCPTCRRTLEWFELVPVLSWLILRGKCRTCHARISIQYPLVELLTCAGFLVIGLAPVALELRILGCLMIAVLVAIAVYDLYHTIIPDAWSYSFAVLALLYSLFADLDVVTLLAGPLVALPLYLLWRVSGGTWMGLGDAKLALGIGWLLGALHGYVALAFAFFIGAFVGVFILIPLPIVIKSLARAGITARGTNKRFTMRSEIPFGPFLICGMLLVWFSQLYDQELLAHLMDFLSWS